VLVAGPKQVIEGHLQVIAMGKIFRYHDFMEDALYPVTNVLSKILSSVNKWNITLKPFEGETDRIF
jgi:hypothetical protein